MTIIHKPYNNIVAQKSYSLFKKKKIIIAYTKNPPKPDQSASKG
jgi:hypothetical protein